eukprot:759250-Hanusia_phi.AAC.2
MSAQGLNTRIVRSALPPSTSASTTSSTSASTTSSSFPRRAVSARYIKEGDNRSASSGNQDKNELDDILAALARENEEVANTPKGSRGCDERRSEQATEWNFLPKDPKDICKSRARVCQGSLSRNAEEQGCEDRKIGKKRFDLYNQHNLAPAASGSGRLNEEILPAREIVNEPRRGAGEFHAATGEARDVTTTASGLSTTSQSARLFVPPPAAEQQPALQDVERISLPVEEFEKETSVVVEPLQDLQPVRASDGEGGSGLLLRDSLLASEGEPIWLTAKETKQHSSEQMLPSLTSLDMRKVPVLVKGTRLRRLVTSSQTETKESFSWSRPRFGRRAREADVQQVKLDDGMLCLRRGMSELGVSVSLRNSTPGKGWQLV